jgi:outer membrane protein
MRQDNIFPLKEFGRAMGSFIKKLAGLTLLLFFIFPGRYAPAEDLVDLYRLARKNDPQLQKAKYEHAASRETLSQAYSNLLPTFAAQGQYIDNAQDIVSSDNAVFEVGKTDYTTKTYTLTLTQPIFHYASIVRVGQANAEIERADAEFETSKQDLMLKVLQLYLEALSAQDRLAFAQAEQAAVESHFELAEGRHSMGLAPITDLYDAKARLSSVKARRIAAENDLDDSFQALREVCGDLRGKIAGLTEEMPLVGPDPADVGLWIKGALDQNLGIKVQRQAVEVAKEEIKRQRSGHYPTLDLVGRFNDQDTNGTLFGGGSEVKTTELLLEANLPIFQGGYVCSRTREASHLYQAALRDLEQQIRAVKRQTRAAYLGVKSAMSRVEALEQSVESQKLALEAKQYGFNSGLYTSLAVLDAERDLYLAKQDYAQARYDYILNSMRLKQAVSTLKEEDLVLANQWFK